MIKTIIFDFGNVIEKFDNSLFIQNLAEYTPKTSAELTQIIYTESSLPQRYEAGLITSDEFYEAIKEISGADISKQIFSEIYSQIFTPIPSTTHLIKDLKAKGYKVGMLSNTSEIDYELGIKPFFERAELEFDAEILSYKIGVMKPQDKIYTTALEKLNSSPEECVYIDDIQRYAEKASQMGLIGIHYRNPSQLVVELRNVGVRI
jgi:putative hydrolase of the HAD superfamily